MTSSLNAVVIAIPPSCPVQPCSKVGRSEGGPGGGSGKGVGRAGG